MCVTIKQRSLRPVKIMVHEPRQIRREVLRNGLTVISEQMQHLRSVSIGVWIKTGSREGSTHRSAEDIARQVDSIGGNMDAFTAKECICFNMKVVDEHLPIAMDVLSDLVLHPLFKDEDITREKNVILEEIKMDEDSPDYLVHEIFTQSFFHDHPLGKPILGTRDTVRTFKRARVVDFYKHCFTPENIIVSAAGNLEHKRFVDLVKKHFGQMKPVKKGKQSSRPKTASRIMLRNKIRKVFNNKRRGITRINDVINQRFFGRKFGADHFVAFALCFVSSEFTARRRDELAPVSKHSRAPGTRLCHLQRPQSISRYWLSVCVRRHVARVGAEGRHVGGS